MCAAFTSSTSKASSSTQYTGFQYSPVDSIATCVTCHCSSQSRSANRSRVLVPNVAMICFRSRPSPGTRTQALMVSRCTSSPHTRSKMTFIRPPWSPFPGEPPPKDSILRAPACAGLYTWGCLWLPGQTGLRIRNTTEARPPLPKGDLSHFHASGCTPFMKTGLLSTPSRNVLFSAK